MHLNFNLCVCVVAYRCDHLFFIQAVQVHDGFRFAIFMRFSAVRMTSLGALKRRQSHHYISITKYYIAYILNQQCDQVCVPLPAKEMLRGRPQISYVFVCACV